MKPTLIVESKSETITVSCSFSSPSAQQHEAQNQPGTGTNPIWRNEPGCSCGWPLHQRSDRNPPTQHFSGHTVQEVEDQIGDVELIPFVVDAVAKVAQRL